MQLVLLVSFAVPVVSALPPPSGAMDSLVDVLMAVMREDAVSWHPSRIVVAMLYWNS